MINEDNRTVSIGGISAFLQKDKERAIFDHTISEINKFARNQSDINCLVKLVKHFHKIFECNSSFVFLVGKDGYIQTISSQSHLPASICANIKNDLKLCQKTSQTNGSAEELSNANIAKLGKSLKKHFSQGVVLRNKMVPLLKKTDSHIVMYFFQNSMKINIIFMKDWLGMLLPIWSHGFTAKIRTFEQLIENFQTTQEINGSDELLKKCYEVQQWLSSSQICHFCEKTMAHLSTKRSSDPSKKLYKGPIFDKINEFAEDWHYCIDRPWPCDDGPVLQNGIFDWLIWNLKGEKENLKTAIYLSNSYLMQGLLKAKKPLQVENTQSKVMLQEILLAIEKGVERIDQKKALRLPIENTEAYNTAKDHLSRFVLVTMSDAPQTPKSIEAIIWTLSQYAYQVLGVDPRLHLASHMRQGARGEPSLHMMKEFYRDHFFHTIEVCFLGHLLTLAQPTTGEKKTAFPMNNKLLGQWYLAALLHDIGYAVDICKSLKDWLDFFVSGSVLNTLGKDIAKMLKKVETLDGFEDFYKKYNFGKEDKPHEDHGLMGAHHLQKLIDDLNTKKRLTNDTKKAIEAIAKHNCQSIRVTYKKEQPLSALLILCDMLQTWHRPQFTHFSMGPAWMMSAMMSSGDSHQPPETASPRLVSNLNFKKCGEKAKPEFKPPLVLRLEFGPEVNRDSFIFNIWLDATRNLQRVDFSQLPYNIVIQIVTPTYVPPKEKKPVKQMDRLRDAAIETHMAYLEKWFAETGNEQKNIPEVDKITNSSYCTKQAVSYYVEKDEDENPVREMLSFNLKSLNGKSDLMTESLSRFRADLKSWQHYHQDRLILGDYAPWKHNQ